MESRFLKFSRHAIRDYDNDGYSRGMIPARHATKKRDHGRGLKDLSCKSRGLYRGSNQETVGFSRRSPRSKLVDLHAHVAHDMFFLLLKLLEPDKLGQEADRQVIRRIHRSQAPNTECGSEVALGITLDALHATTVIQKGARKSSTSRSQELTSQREASTLSWASAIKKKKIAERCPSLFRRHLYTSSLHELAVCFLNY